MGNMQHFKNTDLADISDFLPKEMNEDILKAILTEWAELKTWKAFMTQFLQNMGSEDIDVFLAEIHVLAQENSPTIRRWLDALNAEVEPEPEIHHYEQTAEEAAEMAAAKDAELDKLASDIVNGRSPMIRRTIPTAFKADHDIIKDGVEALAKVGREQ